MVVVVVEVVVKVWVSSSVSMLGTTKDGESLQAKISEFCNVSPKDKNMSEKFARRKYSPRHILFERMTLYGMFIIAKISKVCRGHFVYITYHWRSRYVEHQTG